MSDPTQPTESETSLSNHDATDSVPPETAPKDADTSSAISPTVSATTPQLRSTSGSRVRDASSFTNSNADDNLSLALDLLPQSLVGGGISAMSSRRPSYAAEFSSRPKLLDLPNPSEMASSTGSEHANQGGSHVSQLFQPSFSLSGSKNFSEGGAAARPLFESDHWMRSSEPSRSIWFNNAKNSPDPSRTAAEQKVSLTQSSPGSKIVNDSASPSAGSIFISPLLGNANINNKQSQGSPKFSHGSQNDFMIDSPLGSQRNFRSVSFSHPFDRRPLGSRSPPKSQALGSFYEDAADETADVLSNTHLDDPKRRILRPQKSQQLSMNPTSSHSLWFNDSNATPAASNSAAAAAAAAAVNRRHSFATTIDSHVNAPEGRVRHQSITPVSTMGATPGPSNPARSYDEPQLTEVNENLYSDVQDYFSSDEFGRSHVVMGSTDPVNSLPPSSAAGLISATSNKLYFVQFKSFRVDVFFIPENSALRVSTDDLVIVDADRGRDLGKVIRVNVSPQEAGLLKWRQHLEQQAALQQTPGDPGAANATSTGPSVTTPKQILRFAQPLEIEQLRTKQADEDKAIKMCNVRVQEKGLGMVVLDAEYQWDRRKLTFFYSASYRIDFRDLVRDLFRIYKTRIWMCAVHSSQAGAQMQLHNQHQFQQQHHHHHHLQHQPQHLYPQPHMQMQMQQRQRQQPQHHHPQQFRPMGGPGQGYGDYGYIPNQPQKGGDFPSYSPWQFNASMQGRMMAPPPPGPGLGPGPGPGPGPVPQNMGDWNPMGYDHFDSSSSADPASGPIIPGGGNHY